VGSRKQALKQGDRVQTNARYARVIGNRTPHVGVLIREQRWRSGLWSVDMEGFDRPQLIHESMMEKAK
jgi:hypothetical protein